MGKRHENPRKVKKADKWFCNATKQKKGSPQDMDCKAANSEGYGFEIATKSMGKEAELTELLLDGISFGRKGETFQWQAPSTTGGFYRDLKPGSFTFEERKGKWQHYIFKTEDDTLHIETQSQCTFKIPTEK